MKKYSFLLKGGHVIDPGNKIDKVIDVAIKDEKITVVQHNLPKQDAEKVIDASGLIISPGLIDAHVHCYHSSGMDKAWAGDYSFQPDFHSFRTGVTTMIDTGSSGSYNFSHFKTTVIDRVKTRLYALINIADYGMSSLMVEQFPEKNDLESIVRCCNENKDTVLGIKVAHYNNYDWKDVLYAKKAQEEINIPIMVDFGVFRKERPYDQLIKNYLEKGDISTHCYRGPVPVIDENKRVYQYLRNAKERGIKFDLGHGAGSFLFRNAVPALEQGFYPDSISTDLHALSINGLAIDMPSTMSKIKACADVSWYDIFDMSTRSPAEYFGISHLGRLDAGAVADVSLWNIRTGRFGHSDTGGGFMEGKEKLECEMTFRAGEIVWDANGRTARDYRKLGPEYGFDPAVEQLVSPS